MRRHVLIAPVLGLLCAGCSTLGNLFSSTSPSSTTTDMFNSALTVGGSSFSTFTVSQAGTVTAQLTALGAAGPVGLGLGTPNGSTSCVLTTSSASVVPGSSPQISATENAGNYCVEIFDPGTLTASTTFSITVVHP
ncbi:MAG TPA: hypothetical protein VIX35_11615 [Vicinamibacterales bacterium]